MLYELNGKKIKIPDAEISNSMKSLGISKEDAIEMWLEDEGYLENAEQLELCEKAKANRITQKIHGASAKTGEKVEKKPKTVKVSDEKVKLFNEILEDLHKYYENVEILKENKLIQVKTGGKVFKIDLIEQRQPKK